MVCAPPSAVRHRLQVTIECKLDLVLTGLATDGRTLGTRDVDGHRDLADTPSRIVEDDREVYRSIGRLHVSADRGTRIAAPKLRRIAEDIHRRLPSGLQSSGHPEPS